MLCCVTFQPLCVLTSYSFFDTALVSTLTMGVLAIGPGVSQALFSPGHQHRSMEVRSQNCSNWALYQLWVLLGLLSILTGPTLTCKCTQSPHLLIRHISAVGALVVGLDVLQALSIFSQFQGFNPHLYRYKERFQLFFLRHTAPGTQLWF